MTHITEAPKRIWMDADNALYYGEEYKRDNDVKYYRADRYGALLEAACSLHYHLFEIADTLLNQPDIGEREMADMLDDAQLAIDKYNRFLDGD